MLSINCMNTYLPPAPPHSGFASDALVQGETRYWAQLKHLKGQGFSHKQDPLRKRCMACSSYI